MWAVLGHNWEGLMLYWPQRTSSLFGFLSKCHFRENRSRNATVRVRADRRTQNDFIICPLLVIAMEQIAIGPRSANSLQLVEQLQYKRTTWRMYVLRLTCSSTTGLALVSVQVKWLDSTTLQWSHWLRASFVQKHRTRYKQKTVTLQAYCLEWSKQVSVSLLCCTRSHLDWLFCRKTLPRWATAKHRAVKVQEISLNKKWVINYGGKTLSKRHISDVCHTIRAVHFVNYRQPSQTPIINIWNFFYKRM